jgi:hypothetical protein
MLSLFRPVILNQRAATASWGFQEKNDYIEQNASMQTKKKINSC